ncbi:hypothetical protein EZ428_13610 [Pedobacter frigiditerrae]|uniref:Uncharacterized protein n=1 Tax=Pedobacter frigiditerrae TaxID=2530452 RepID=A0A4R0MTB7_9SPHI|nr:hypothetical protein [Pedobacter frigiditerrae]TCC90309.1 hypothetical protein EZ428_13610 [Pedobacter frigiditerrae]
MENQNQHKPKAKDISLVSRKTNEEIDEDEKGNLIIGGKISGNQAEPSDGLFTEDFPIEKSSLIDNQNQAQD